MLRYLPARRRRRALGAARPAALIPVMLHVKTSTELDRRLIHRVRGVGRKFVPMRRVVVLIPTPARSLVAAVRNGAAA